MKFLSGLDLKTILFLLLAVVVVFGLFKKLFKLAILAGLIGLAFYLYSHMM